MWGNISHLRFFSNFSNLLSCTECGVMKGLLLPQPSVYGLEQPSDRCLVTVYSSTGEQFLCISLCAWNTNNPVHGFHLQVSGLQEGGTRFRDLGCQILQAGRFAAVASKILILM